MKARLREDARTVYEAGGISPETPFGIELIDAFHREENTMATYNGRLWLAVVGFVLMTLRPASAADPIIGTWKLDVGSSKFVVAPPKEQTEVYRETDSGEIEMRLTRLQSDSKSTSTTL